MKVAVWTSEQYGPAAVFLLTTGKLGITDSATIPQCPPGPVRQWAAKGSDPSWRQWAEHLANGLPHGGQWSVQEVPDGSNAREALYQLRSKAQDVGLTQANPASSMAGKGNTAEGKQP